jgi:hydroxymethylpyrimidine/phosphomethylpyrimidine kinase
VSTSGSHRSSRFRHDDRSGLVLLVQHVALDCVVVAVGGLDASGGAGLIRDFLTARALEANAHMVATALTDQDDAGVFGVEVRAGDSVRRHLAAALSRGQRDGRAIAVKIGMVGDAALVPAIVEALAGFAGPVVYDPVLAASSGGSLYRGELAALAPLLARAALVTPNRSEAAALAGVAVDDVAGARAAGEALRAGGARAVLVKGGHLDGDEACDVLVSEAGAQVLRAPRVAGRDPRGTGCALATAIAVGLARGVGLAAAVGEAKAWLRTRIAEGDGGLPDGRRISGAGPGFRWW